jgi:hypothetical protein
VRSYAELTLAATRTTLNLVLEYVADDQTSDGLLRHIINPALEPIKESLKVKAAEILKHHQRGHPITYNHYFTENVQKARNAHRKKVLSKRLHSYFGIAEGSQAARTVVNRSLTLTNLLETLSSETEADMDKFSCSEGLDCMEAYYKVSLSMFREHASLFSDHINRFD